MLEGYMYIIFYGIPVFNSGYKIEWVFPIVQFIWFRVFTLWKLSAHTYFVCQGVVWDYLVIGIITYILKFCDKNLVSQMIILYQKAFKVAIQTCIIVSGFSCYMT